MDPLKCWSYSLLQLYVVGIYYKLYALQNVDDIIIMMHDLSWNK